MSRYIKGIGIGILASEPYPQPHPPPVSPTMFFSFTRVAFLATVISAVVAAPNPEGPKISVNLRIEGATSTIFEGHIRTRGENVTTPSGGTHLCDGTNNGANPSPGATCTSALADASRKKGFPFDGTFDTAFDDFFITSIGDSTETSTQFWGLLLNFQFTPVGGCQQEVTAHQDILWAFDAFNAVSFLKAVGPSSVRKGQPATYTITDGSTGTPIAGASIGGATTDATGTATITFTHKGRQVLKASKASSIRSNRVVTHVV